MCPSDPWQISQAAAADAAQVVKPRESNSFSGVNNLLSVLEETSLISDSIMPLLATLFMVTGRFLFRSQVTFMF